MGKPAPSPPNLRPLASSKTPNILSCPSPRRAERLQLTLASEDPAINSAPKAVSLIKWHSLFAHNTAPAASFEGSTMLCNDDRHTSAPTRSESWGADDMQVDFTGLSFIRPYRSSPDRVRQCTPKVSGALTSLDPRWGRSIRALAMSSLSNSSKPRTSSGPDRSEVRTATSIRDHANGSNLHSTCEFP